MIEKPEIDDQKIIAVLNNAYSIQASHIEFLPIGNDSSAFSYRVDTRAEISYFLKLKKNLSNLAGLFAARFLKDIGIQEVVAPLATNTRELWTNLDRFSLILYPFVTGDEAMKVGMSDAQWKEFGSVLKQFHSTELPPGISHHVKQETFIPKWSSLARELQGQVNTGNYNDPYQEELAAFWKKNNETIQTVVERTETIGKLLQQTMLEFVLCHADIHTANILLTRDQQMSIVDWDDTLFAPKERDLMFVLNGDTICTPQEQMFFDGYGPVKIHQPALAYYRYEWCVQEIGDFGERVFLSKDTGESTKQDSVEGFIRLFSPNDAIETALKTAVEI